MAGLREREAYEYALWQSGRAPTGAGPVLTGLKFLAVVAVAGAILGLAWLQRLPAPAPPAAQPRQESPPSSAMEVYFVFESEPGAQHEPVRLVGGHVGMKTNERP